MSIFKSLLMFLPLLSSFSSFGAGEIKSDLRICTGESTGSYHTIGKTLRASLSKYFNVSLVKTQGSLENLEKIALDECDLSFVQSDAEEAFRAFDEELYAMLETTNLTPKSEEFGEGFYLEQVHLVCNKSLGAESLDDILDFSTDFKKKKRKEMPIVYTGPEKGGSNTTFENLGQLDKKYAAIFSETTKEIRTKSKPPKTLLAYQTALLRTAKSKNSCMFYVTRAPNKLLQKVSKLTKKYKDLGGKTIPESLEILEISDRDFLKQVDKKGNQIYFKSYIKRGYYTTIRKDEDIPTIAVAANLVAADRFLDEIEGDQEAFDFLNTKIIEARNEHK